MEYEVWYLNIDYQMGQVRDFGNESLLSDLTTYGIYH